MPSLWSDLDGVLRGKGVDAPDAAPIPLTRLLSLIVLLGAAHGFFVGWYAVLQHPAPEWRQMASAMAKIPLLFLLTVAVTFPSLYVFNALVGSKLAFQAALRLVLSTALLAVTVLASFGPILGFFTASTPGYGFMVALNIGFAGVAGLMGMSFLVRTLGGRGVPDAQARATFRIWAVIFALVGMQMSWVLRPFVGEPTQPFALLRARDSNFFVAAVATFKQLLLPGK